MASVQPVIHLTLKEQRLRRLLLDVATSINDTRKYNERVVLRWAGGWVRDKLLNADSNDIDVAINIMTGEQFAQSLFQYCRTPEAIHKHNIGIGEVGNLHKVDRNPEKSKYLETAMVKLFGLDLDFVNLRKETYADHSRNPLVSFGTAEEDAFRRDATINAIFYNLHTQELEDFTGGIRDIEARVIQTPLQPLQTFMDDPLRVLRLIRFASRLKFSIHPTAETCMNDPDVLKAFRVKISRERVGVELEKMLRGDHPHIALQLLDRLCLFPVVFNSSSPTLPPMPDISRWHVAYYCLKNLLQDRAPGSIGRVLVPDDDAKYLAWNFAAVSPWIAVDDPRSRTSVPPPVVIIAREAFKAPNKVTKVIAACHRHLKEILHLKAAICDGTSLTHQRGVYGMAIRKWDAQGGHWRVQIIGAMLVEAMEQLSYWRTEDDQERDRFIQGWRSFLDHLASLDLYNAPDLRHLLNGQELAEALSVPPGRWTGKALEICMAWQLRHPKERNPAGAIQEIRKRCSELEINL